MFITCSFFFSTIIQQTQCALVIECRRVLSRAQLPNLHDSRRALRLLGLRQRLLLSALLLGLAVLACLRAVAPPPASTTTVVVAAHDLPAGAVVTDADLTTVALPDAAVPTGLASTTYAIGRSTTGPVRRGEPITTVRLVG